MIATRCAPAALAVLAAIAVVTLAFADTLRASTSADRSNLDRGRYLVKIGGCNDCHTTGYTRAGGQVDEKEWLTGHAVGFRGPWGTTYPPNLRLYVRSMNEDQWVARTKRGESRPPMPWFSLRAMTEGDLRAMYRYIRALGAAGEPAPAYVPPTAEPQTPFILLAPQPAKAGG